MREAVLASIDWRARTRQEPLESRLAQRQEAEQRRIVANLERFGATLRRALADGTDENALFSLVEARRPDEIAQYRRDRATWEQRAACRTRPGARSGRGPLPRPAAAPVPGGGRLRRPEAGGDAVIGLQGPQICYVGIPKYARLGHRKMPSSGLVPRRARREIEETLQVLRVAVLNGPRQAGKTTLARQLVAATGGSFVTLDDPATLQACLGDPRTFLTAYRKPLVVDEFQLAGDVLLRSVKSIVDTDLERGQYLLTGSTRFLTVPSISESLAGRAGIVDLWPYTQGEAERRGEDADGFLAQLLHPEMPIRQLPETPPTRTSYLSRICIGGYPEVQQLAGPAQRRRWFDAYIRTVTSRDVPGISRIQHVAELPKLLAALAAMTGQQLVVTRLAEKVTLSRQTVDSTYLPLLETVFMTVRLPAWSRNLLSRITRHPKSYVADTGVAAHLLGVDEEALADPMCAATGPLVETFVVNELIRQQSFGGHAAQLSHYRTHDGVEVDVVAEAPDGRVGGIEVKSSATVSLADFRHLARLRDLLDASGGRFVRGVVLYTGDQVLPFGDRLVAMPLAALWMPFA